jgi:putative endopeptidase
MSLFRTTALIATFAIAVSLGAVAAAVDQDASTQDNTQDMDRSIKPGDDFYRYANGGWLRTAAISSGQSSYDTRAMLTEKTSRRVRDLIQGAAAAQSVRASIAQKVGDYYASFMEEDAIEAKGLAPMADEMARISAIRNRPSLSAYLGATLNTEVDGLTANADHVFGAWVNQSFTDSEHYVFHLFTGWPRNARSRRLHQPVA